MQSRRWTVMVVGGLLLGGPVAAQEPPGPPEGLRQQVMERFLENFRRQAALTDDQFRQFRSVAVESWQKRQVLERREREIARGLEHQLRPGIAADPDSVHVLLEAMLALRQARVDLLRREQETYAEFLSPVQRAQLVLMTARFERQVGEILRRRGQGRGRNR